jgi:hypothetical protein
MRAASSGARHSAPTGAAPPSRKDVGTHRPGRTIKFTTFEKEGHTGGVDGRRDEETHQAGTFIGMPLAAVWI